MADAPSLVASPVVAALVAALGEDVVTLGEALGDRRNSDWSGVSAGIPKALVRPRSTE